MLELLDPKTDFAFRKLFGSNTDKSKRILLSLINAYVVKDPRITPRMTIIEEIRVINPYNIAEFDADKESILDIKAMDENGHLYNIEMQATSDSEYFRRALFYWAKVYASQISQGEKYSKLRKTIGIHFLNFSCIESSRPEYHHVINLANCTNPKLVPFGIDLLEIHLIELSKFQREYSPFNVAEEEWTQFFANTQKCFADLDKIKTREIKEAMSDLDKFNLKGIDRQCYEASLKRMATESTLVEQAEERGEKNATIKLAKGLKAKGMTSKEIADLTGLSVQVVDSL